MALHGWRPDEVSQLVSQAIWESNKRMEERQDRRLNLVLGSLKHLKDELRRQKEVQQEQLLELDLARQEIEKGRARQEEMLQKQKDSAELHSHVFEAVRRADAGLSSLERKILAWEQLHMQPPPISSSQQEVPAGTQRCSFASIEEILAWEQLHMQPPPISSSQQEVKDSNDEASSDVTAALSSHSDIQEETSWMHSTQERFAAYDQDLLDLREQLEVVKREHSNLAGGSILLHDRIDILEKNAANHDHWVKLIWEKMPDEETASEGEEESASEDEEESASEYEEESASEDEEAQEDETMMVQAYEPEYE